MDSACFTLAPLVTSATEGLELVLRQPDPWVEELKTRYERLPYDHKT